MKTSEIFSEALGIEPAPKQEVVEVTPVIEPTKNEVELTPDAEEDYTLSRNTFRQLIRKGNDVMENLTDLAKESESPRAYEVLATMMKTIADTTKDLYDLQKKTKDLKSKEDVRPQDSQRISVEKAVFVGSTAELLKKVKGNENS